MTSKLIPKKPAIFGRKSSVKVIPVSKVKVVADDDIGSDVEIEFDNISQGSREDNVEENVNIVTKKPDLKSAKNIKPVPIKTATKSKKQPVLPKPKKITVVNRAKTESVEEFEDGQNTQDSALEIQNAILIEDRNGDDNELSDNENNDNTEDNTEDNVLSDNENTKPLIRGSARAKKNTEKKVTEKDIEAEFDKVILESVLSNDEEESDLHKKIIGSKAKLKAMMNKVDQDEESDIPVKKTKLKKTTTKTGVKKGPGRPRKIPKKEPIPRGGIADIPSSANGFIEFIYDLPLLIKKIFQHYKALAVAQIQIIFRPTDIIFYAEDHYQKSKSRIKIDASKLNHYYCRGVLDIGVQSKDMELILNKIDKEYSSIILMSNVESTQRIITILLDNDMQIDETHSIDIITPLNKRENESEFTDEDYAIKFEFPSKYFRKMINDIKTMSTQLSITQEDSDSQLVFEYLTANKKIHSKHTVKNSKKIKLESNLSDGDSFRVDIRIDYIKPISASQIADEVQILVDENKPFMTKAIIDNGTIEIKTLTEIIDERPEDDD